LNNASHEAYNLNKGADMATRKTATKPAPAAKAAKAPASKGKAAKAAAAPVSAPKAEPIEYGSAWLVEHVNEQAGTSYTASTLRILLRKLTRDGVLEREAEGRQRYNFPKGANDPQVKAIVKAVKGGAAEKAKQERLDGLKEQRAAKKSAAPKKSRSKKAAAAEVEEDVEDDLDVDEI
jgi:DNA-binding transcriptional ArsR family regulator